MIENIGRRAKVKGYRVQVVVFAGTPVIGVGKVSDSQRFQIVSQLDQLIPAWQKPVRVTIQCEGIAHISRIIAGAEGIYNNRSIVFPLP